MTSAIDWRVNTFADLTSTQDYARELAEEGLPEGTVIQALKQSRGRGRQGRTWESPMGNLYMSFLLRPQCPAEKAGQMSFVAAVAVSAAIDAYLEEGHRKTLKWPNDVLIDGKKCAGILIETSLKPPLPSGERDGVRGGMPPSFETAPPPHPTLSPQGRGLSVVDALIIGIGVNILAPPEGTAGLAALSGGKPVPIHPFRDKVLEEIARFYRQWQHQGFGPIRTRWLKQAHALDETITARFSQEEAQGIFRGIDEKGALLLETEAGQTRAIAAAEIII